MMNMIIQENCLIQVIKELKDYLFFLTEIKVVLIELQLILTQDIFFQELKSAITTLKLMEEIFMIKQLMIQLSNEIRKISTGQADDYKAGCLLDFTY